MIANSSSTCIDCLKQSIDITEGITKEDTLYHCRTCDRWLRPPWIKAEMESAQLLSICLKNVKGMKGIKLIDSKFLYTEPHSQRIKVKLTVQKEVFHNTMLQ
jgi:nonsense-mediated mRNA decay protein 3